MLPKASIIILTYNARSTLRQALDKAILSALNQDYSNVEVILVDNGSSDDTYEYVNAKYGDKIRAYKLSRNHGYALGNNKALKLVSEDSKYVLFQNPDVILSRDYVRKLVNLMQKDPSIAAIQGLELQPHGKTYRVGGTLNTAGYSVDFLPVTRNSSRPCLECLFAFGAALLVNRRVFELVGGFPPDYFMYYDEADLGFRLRALGFKVVGCTVTGYLHYVSGTVSRLEELHPTVYYFAARNRLLTILKYFHGSFLLRALALNSVILLVHFVRGGAVKRRILVRALLSVFARTRRIVTYRRLYLQGTRDHRVLRIFIERWPIAIRTPD